MEPVSIILLTLGLVTQVERVVLGIQSVKSSREEAMEQRRQKKYFFRRINKIDDLIQRQQPLIPPKLFRIADRLSDYSRNCGRDIFRFYKEFLDRSSLRFFTRVCMSIGWNQMDEYQTRLEDCEDWLNISHLTVSLWVSDEARRRSSSSLPEDFAEWHVLQEREEIQAKDQLRQRLTRIQRAKRTRNRYRRIKGAGIRLNELERLAEVILDDPITETTRSEASSRPSRRNPRHSPQRNLPRSIWSPAELSRSAPVFLRASERERRSYSSQRPEYDPASEPAILGRRQATVVRNSQPARSHDLPDERAGYQSSSQRRPSNTSHQTSTQRRSSSPSQDPDSVDESSRVRRAHIIRDTRPPPSYDPGNEGAGWQVPPRRRSSSASRNSDLDDRSRRRSSSDGGDPGFVDGSPRVRTQHVLRSSRPPISNYPNRERPGRRRRSWRSRSSSFGYDSGIEMADNYAGYESARR